MKAQPETRPEAQMAAELDGASLQILLSKFSGIAEEMGLILQRSAFSPNIKERVDCSAALFTPDGELLAQAEHIPVHLGAMPVSVKAVVERFGSHIMAMAGQEDGQSEGGRSEGGQTQNGQTENEQKELPQVILNDPFVGGTHINDITIVAPCVLSGQLVGWVANRAHHADLGGAVPGSMPPGARTIYEEGLRIQPVIFSPEVMDLICANSRTPGERKGDLDAQIGANRYGVEAMLELADSFSNNPSADSDNSSSSSSDSPADRSSDNPSDNSSDSSSDSPPLKTSSPNLIPANLAQFLGNQTEVMNYGERMMCAAIKDMPDGVWHFSDVMDTSGPEEDQRSPAEIKLKLSIAGEEISFDFAGSSSAMNGSTNAVYAVTLSCVAFALRSAVDLSIPANGGAFRPVKVSAPEGSLVAAQPPVAVGAGNVEVSQRIADVCFGALAQVVPDRVGAASQGTMNNVLIGGNLAAGGTSWVYYETIGGGQGGRPVRAGMSGVQTGMTNTKNTPIEALERSFKMRVRQQNLRRNSGGDGLFPGGDGIIRDLEMLEPTTVSLICERQDSQPWGLAGGLPGACGEAWLLPGGSEENAIKLKDKVELKLDTGDVVRLLTPGGGGWGTSKDTSKDTSKSKGKGKSKGKVEA